jgi:predicted Rossmann fold nucleotide-binding protein DprA/Smf involved in DNA uptake
MARRSDRALASLLLTNRLTETAARPLAAGEFWSLVETVEDPARLLGLDAAEVARSWGFTVEHAERVATLLDAGAGLAFELDRLEQEGFGVLSPFDDGYPARLVTRLREAAPPVLVAAGPTSLVEEDGIGIVGSRDVSPEGVAVARKVAELAVASGFSVVSGGARGVDQQATAAAYQAGGKVVGVLAESLLRRVRDPETRRVIGEGAACLVTPYKPDAGFGVANAMGRNKIVYGLSRVTLVVASELETGGTWEGAREALGRRFGAVAVWMGAGAGTGNAALARLGAVPVHRIDEVLEPTTSAVGAPSGATKQLKLGM